MKSPQLPKRCLIQGQFFFKDYCFLYQNEPSSCSCDFSLPTEDLLFLVISLSNSLNWMLFMYYSSSIILLYMSIESHQIIMDVFLTKLEENRQKAEQKKEEYLEKIMQIFRDFVRKSQQQIDNIINKKIKKMQYNYIRISQYFEEADQMNEEERNLILAQYLVKPFEKFPFSGNKNQNLFKQQTNLIEKAALLIEQTLVDSFTEEQIPTFENTKFFQSVHNYGLGQQSLTKLKVSAQSLKIELKQEFTPLQRGIQSIKMMGEYLILVGDDTFLQIWDLQSHFCIKKLYLDNLASVNCLTTLYISDLICLAVGFGDQNPSISIYRSDNWNPYGYSLVHTRSITKIIQIGQFILSGSLDGNICIYTLEPFTHLHTFPHTSSIQDIFCKNSFIYILLKCSSLCQYQLQTGQDEISLHFRRMLSTGFISMIRYTQVGNNFSGVACHIYGLSQISITRKFKVQEKNIINVSQMIADFVVVESKSTSQYFAICVFQNSSALRVYSLKKGQIVYEVDNDYQGEVGVAGYMPKVQITWSSGKYWIIVVNQAQFDTPNTIKVYSLTL